MQPGLGETACAVLDGRIYVAGGYNTRVNFQIYDVAANSWQAGPVLPNGTDNAVAAAANGKVYVFGGEAGNVAQIFTPADRTWATLTAPAVRFASSGGLIDGRFHLAGGWSLDRSNNVSVASHDVFDLTAGSFAAAAAPMPTARNHAAAAVIAGKLYVAGGRAPGHEAEDAANVARLEIYDPATNAWSAGADLPTPRSGAAAASVGGKLYVLGGSLPGATMYKAVERYDPAANAWEKLADMPDYATGHCAVAAGNDLYVVGGFAHTGDQRQGFSGVANAWRYTPQ